MIESVNIARAQREDLPCHISGRGIHTVLHHRLERAAHRGGPWARGEHHVLVEVSLVEAELWAGEVSLIAEELRFRFLGAPEAGDAWATIRDR